MGATDGLRRSVADAVLRPAAPAMTHAANTPFAGASAPASARLAGKLRAPQPAAFEVLRGELCDRIFNAGAAQLVLLRAPAGFGKTTVMLQVRRRMAETGLPTVWLTLDAADNDVGHFLAALTAALAPHVPGLLAFESASGSAGGAESLALMLVDRLAAHPAPLALFLDDFESIQNPAVLGLVQELIEQLPRGLQAIMGCRGVPEIGLGRLRARGRLLDIDPSHLRFTEREADDLLRVQRGLPLLAEDVRQLHRSTEGWAVALWLASVSLENRDTPARFIAGFSGSNAAVMDYLVEDVLARQSPAVREFLLRTSLLRQFDASLCDAVCGRDDSASMLAALDKANLFLIAMQGEGGEYRYHGMFAQCLQAQAQRQLASQLPGMHLAASRWFLARGRPVPAIDHALASGDLAQALPLLAEHAQPLLDQGRVRLLCRWLDPLVTDPALQCYPMLQAVHAWAVCFARGPRAALPWLERLEAADHDDPAVRAYRAALRPLVLALTDQTDEALPLAAEVLATISDEVPFVSSFVEVTMANLALMGGHYGDALRLADSARRRQPEHRSHFNLALSEAAEASVDLVQGRLRKAIARLRLAVSTGALEVSRATNGNALVGVPLAEALYESGQCDQAERLLTVYIPLIRSVGIPDQLIIAHVTMARIVADRGDADHAEQLLAELEHLGHRDGLPRVVAAARLERARQQLMAGRLPAARAELDRCADPALWQRVALRSMRAHEVDTHALGSARWSIHAGQAQEVLPFLRRELVAAERAQRLRRALCLRLLLALAWARCGQGNRAMRQLATAVLFAAREGYQRAFIDEGPPMQALLRELHKAPDLLPNEGGMDVHGFLERLLPARAPQVAPAAAVAAPGALVDGTLTRKEVQVLRLAAEGLSNLEIADRLFVAETTVRSHLRNVNVKLDARNRMEAIAIARRGGLIP